MNQENALTSKQEKGCR